MIHFGSFLHTLPTGTSLIWPDSTDWLTEKSRWKRNTFEAHDEIESQLSHLPVSESQTQAYSYDLLVLKFCKEITNRISR